MRPIVLLAAVSACFSISALAQTERELDSHEHGAASLNVAVADSAVFLEFNTPWNNLVGFEHAPRTDDQHELVEKAMQLLNNPDELFVFIDGDCSVVDVVLENTMALSSDDHDEEHGHDDEHHDEEHGHDDEHHDEEHGHDDEHHEDEHGHDDEHSDKHDDDADSSAAKSDDHDHDHGEAHGDSESTHSTVLGIYGYECGNVSQLDTIALSLFEQWPGLIDLDVQLVGDNGQTLIELNRDNTSLDVSQVR